MWSPTREWPRKERGEHMGNAVKGGFSCLLRNKWYSLASVLTVAVCIFLFGSFYSILADLQETLHAAQEEVTVTVFFQEGTGEEDILSFKEKLEKREEVARVAYTSAEDAWADFSQAYLGDKGESFKTNPLKDSASLQICMEDLGAQGDLVAYLENQTMVRSVKYSKAAADSLFGAGSLLTLSAAGVVGILLAVSVFLISMTITVGIVSRKEEIEILKYIGASDFFVCGPYVTEGLLIGLTGAALPLGILWYLYDRAVLNIGQNFTLVYSLMRFLPAETLFRTLVPVSLGLGMGIGLLGSLLTVRKHLKV